MTTGPRFDIRFAGELVPGTDPDAARRHLQQLFKLDDEAGERLFCGKTVTIKRGVDGDTVARYRERFREAGALIQAIPAVATIAAEPSGDNLPGAEGEPAPRPGAAGPDVSHLALAPLGGWLEEPSPIVAPPVDISHLSLVPGTDWTFEDCQIPPPATFPPEISHLHLEPIEVGPEAART